MISWPVCEMATRWHHRVTKAIIIERHIHALFWISTYHGYSGSIWPYGDINLGQQAIIIWTFGAANAENKCMMMSSNGTICALLGIYAGTSPVNGEFRAQRQVTRSFYVFFDLRLDKRLSKQSWGWWFETLSHPLWRHANGLPIW